MSNSLDNEPKPGCSKDIQPNRRQTSRNQDSNEPESEGTPSKFLVKISPIPRLNDNVKTAKRSKKGAVVLTSKENREHLKKRLNEKTEKESKQSKPRPTKRKLYYPSTDGKNNSETLDQSNNSSLTKCKECDEVYEETKKKCDWLRCASCKYWLHDDCTIFDIFCVDCGRENKKKANIV